MEIVKNLSRSELLAISSGTILRIVREVGSGIGKSRNKALRLNVSNGWNSEIEGIRLYKGQLSVEIYLQYENTDTNTSVHLPDFLQAGNYRGSVIRSDRHGNNRSYYFTYTDSDKAEFVKFLLLEYLYWKYPNKLI
ncbi:MAG: hypothetical protein HDR86_00710 [Bacteroides sp.]|nr:hypothetical protein [Bacteroides sp.]